jgi:hypothetical protein
MVPKVFWVRKALPALQAEMLALPYFVVDAFMVTGGVSLRHTSRVWLRYIPQSTFGIADHPATSECAWESRRGHLAAVGSSDDGSHVTDFVMERLLFTDPITKSVWPGLIRKPIGGMQDMLLSPGKTITEAWTFLCDSICMTLFACSTRKRTRPNGRTEPGIRSLVVY